LSVSLWQTAIVDETTMFTGLENVFAGGDFRRGAATAIEAIADGRIAAKAIDNYLATGEIAAELIPFDSKKAKSVKDISPAEYSIFEPQKRKEICTINSILIPKISHCKIELYVKLVV
jgi:formate dehydrogenase major subunit